MYNFWFLYHETIIILHVSVVTIIMYCLVVWGFFSFFEVLLFKELGRKTLLNKMLPL